MIEVVSQSVAQGRRIFFAAANLVTYGAMLGGLAGAVGWPTLMRRAGFGVAMHRALLAIAPAILPWALPFTLGYLVAIPFAVVTASPAFGRWCLRRGLCAVPEERDPPVKLDALWNGTR
jgi:membrane glycosyltransferase